MFDKDGEGFLPAARRPPFPVPFLFSHPYGRTGEGSGEAFGQRQKTPPSARDGGDWNKGSTTIRPPSLFSYLAA